MYPVYKIEDDQADKVLNTQESYLNDIKAKEIKPAKLSETISAFANAAGGDVYIGIGENKTLGCRTWCGFDDPEQANALSHTLFDAHPFGNHIKFEFLANDRLHG